MDTLNSVCVAGREWLQRRLLVFKLAGLALLGLLLLIPLGMVRSTLWERSNRHQAAVKEIKGIWGREQQVLGPVLVVPYTYPVESEEWVSQGGTRVLEKRIRRVQAEAYLLPESLEVHGELRPSERRRGLYRTQVYDASLRLSGRFAPADLSFLPIAGVEPQWTQARVVLAFSDLRGVREQVSLQWNEQAAPLQPGSRWEGHRTGLHALVPLPPGAPGPQFSLALDLQGSDALTVVPIGQETRVRLTSAWPSPSFQGAYFPAEREVSAEGFSAAWRVSSYGRSYPSRWTTQSSEHRGPTPEELASSAFGVTLLEEINAYRAVERAIKYGVLFIAVVFATGFIFESLGRGRLNALQYLLIGAALCLFYLILLALSEFIPFGAAYALAAAVATAMIALYASRALGARRAGLLGLLLSGVYGYLYFVLHLEDFALLAGTGLLVLALAAVMYFTRSLTPSAGLPPEPGSPPARA